MEFELPAKERALIDERFFLSKLRCLSIVSQKGLSFAVVWYPEHILL